MPQIHKLKLVLIINGTQREWDIDADLDWNVSQLCDEVCNPHRGCPSDTPPAGQMQLTHESKIITNSLGNTLEYLGVKPGATIEVTEDPLGAGAAKFGEMPKKMAATQTRLLANPEIMQAMMNAPAMQTLLNNPHLMKSILLKNPEFNRLVEAYPALEQMMFDEEFQLEALEAFRNPTDMRNILQATETCLKNPPAGLDGMRKTYRDVIEKPIKEKKRKDRKSPTNRRRQRRGTRSREASSVMGECFRSQRHGFHV